MRSISLIILMTVCLAFLVVGPFAGSALAQDDETPVGPDTILQNRLLHEVAAAKAAAALPGNAAPAVNAQQQTTSSAASPLSTVTCAFTFTSGSGQTYLQFCVTVNGNIVEFQSPVNVEQIRQGGYVEGYGVCDATTGVAYYDFAVNDSGNWNAPVTISSSPTSVKIGRTTTDGAWTLTQTLTMVGGMNPSAKITMALKNNSASTKFVYLIRNADSDPDHADAAHGGFGYLQNLDATLDSAWAYIGESNTSGNDHYGLMLQIVGNPSPTSVPYGRLAYARNTSSPPLPCSPFANLQSPITATDGSIAYFYDFSLIHGQTVTINERYMSF